MLIFCTNRDMHWVRGCKVLHMLAVMVRILVLPLIFHSLIVQFLVSKNKYTILKWTETFPDGCGLKFHGIFSYFAFFVFVFHAIALQFLSWITKKTNIYTSLKSTSVSVCFRGISRLPSAFVFLRWFKLAHISIQVCTFHDGCKQGIDQQIFNRKSISRKITHPQSWKLQAKLTGDKLKGWSNSREKTNSRLQLKFRNTSS